MIYSPYKIIPTEVSMIMAINTATPTDKRYCRKNFLFPFTYMECLKALKMAFTPFAESISVSKKAKDKSRDLGFTAISAITGKKKLLVCGGNKFSTKIRKRS